MLLPALLLALMVGAMGAGPDEPRASSVNDNWQVFEGHAFADSRAVPKGASLVACLGGCDEGYVSTPVVIGDDGRYSNLRVAPGKAPKGDLITFWLVNKDDRLEAVQSWIYEGDGQTRKLHLSFKELPVGFTRVSHMPATGVTTDLTVPSAAELGWFRRTLSRAWPPAGATGMCRCCRGLRWFSGCCWPPGACPCSSTADA